MAKPLRVPPSAALEAMLLADQARGVEVLNDAPRPPGPPVQSKPLLPAMIPPPNWREEEEARARAEAAAKAEELEPPPETYPAAKQAKEKRKPNLEKAQAIRDEVRRMRR